jgi:ferredoxin-type protein NapH
MKPGGFAGTEAIAAKGWLAAHRYLLLRRLVQLGILGLFLLGPWFGWWLVKGNIASSLTLDLLPMTDPLLLAQLLAAGHWPETPAWIGALIVVLLYLLVGGRAYCSWVCPINLVTDASEWLRSRLKIRGHLRLSSRTRYWLLGGVILLPLLTGALAWELVNPVTLVYRGLIFGMGLAWSVLLGLFLFDLLIGRRAWCGHLCPVGAFYGLLGEGALLRISASRRHRCDDCLDCFAVCPEPQVIRPSLKDPSHTPVILAGHCTNCGRCIDVCARDVFRFTSRFDHTDAAEDPRPLEKTNQPPEVQP